MTNNQVTQQTAALGDVEQYVGEAKVAWLQCRSKGHNMLDHDVKLDEVDGELVFIVILRCSRCYTKRHETVDNRTGEVLFSKYTDHPDGYLLPRGTGRLDKQGRGIIRVARLRNTLERKRDLTELATKRTRKSR